ncbi:MAG: hypothetical protein DMG05_00130 [Acidobacteria bacterium]|nr:MAG: hypothetical protein DMG05_00130 [Acidobacteriota bacterium]
MIHRLFRRFWTHFLIAFDDNYTLEGFERAPKKFDLPKNFTWLDSHLKRKLTICNLFANQNQSIRNIARVLEVDLGDVVSALIEDGLIKERRTTAEIIKQERRQERILPWSLAGHHRVRRGKP